MLTSIILSGFLGNRNNYVVVTARHEPVIFVQSFNHVPNAREASAIRSEWGGPSSALSIAKHLLDSGLSKATLGYVGDVPVQSYLAWQRELAGWQFQRCDARFPASAPGKERRKRSTGSRKAPHSPTRRCSR